MSRSSPRWRAPWRRRFRSAPDSQSVLDELQVGVLVLDEADRMILANPAARRMGLVRRVGARDELSCVAVRTLADQVRRAGRAMTRELDLPPAGEPTERGKPYGVNLRAVALPNGCVTIEAADVTAAHRVDKVRRDFVANVSHELKTPVGALRLLAEALIEAMRVEGPRPTGEARPVDQGGDGGVTPGLEPDLEAVRRFAQRIRHESARLGRLVGDLLELTRLETAEPPHEPAAVQIDAVLAEVIDRSRTQAAAKRIEVVPGGDHGLVVYGNESQLVTAVANLVENAVAYSPDHTRVGLAARARDDVVEIVVTDEGIGIEPKDIDRIFERFYRADKARSRATGGTGLGLAIVKHVATNHGGGVVVSSDVGVGSTFTLRLPTRPRPGGGVAPRRSPGDQRRGRVG